MTEHMSEKAGAHPLTAKQLAAQAEICTLRDWLGDMALNIPDYQRPYKWGLPQVQQLLRDI